jgi:hypothetical protein
VIFAVASAWVRLVSVAWVRLAYLTPLAVVTATATAHPPEPVLRSPPLV